MAYFKRAMPGVTAKLIANVNPGSQGKQTLQTLATQGWNAIVTNGNFAPDVATVAPRFSKLRFFDPYSSKPAKNVTIYGAGDEEGGYLNGILAGLMTKTNVIGYVGSFPFPATKRVFAAWVLGAQSVNPKVTAKVLWVNSYYDPTKETQAASTLVGAGADVLMQDNSSPSSATVAQRRHVMYVGWSADRRKQAPNAWLGGFNYNWGPILVQMAKDAAAGRPGRIIHAGFRDRGVFVYPFGSSVPKSAAARVRKALAGLISGKLVIFKGPIVDSSGKVVLAKGKTIRTPEQLNGCCDWFVKGATSG
jgi:basic membrane protein A